MSVFLKQISSPAALSLTLHDLSMSKNPAVQAGHASILKDLDVFELIQASYAAQAVHALVHHEIPDRLLEKSASLAALATQCDVSPLKLELLLDVGVSMGLLGLAHDKYFLKKKGIRLTRALGSWERGYLVTWGEALQPAMCQTNTWLCADTSAYEAANGMAAWEHYRSNRVLGSAYEEFQDRISHLAHIPQLVAAIALKPGERFLDVAGGKGALTLALATQHPGVEGTVLDQPYMQTAFAQSAAKRPRAWPSARISCLATCCTALPADLTPTSSNTPCTIGAMPRRAPSLATSLRPCRRRRAC